METNQAAFKTSPNGMIIVGEDTTVSHLNPVAEEIFACTSKEVRGKKFYEFLKEMDINDSELLDKCDANTPYGTNKRTKTKNGKTRYLDLWITFQPETSEESRYLVFVNDITTQKHREAKLKQAYATETTLKKVLHICRTVEKLEDTLKHALQLTVALPGIKAIPRALIMSTKNDLSQLELEAYIGLNHKELSTFFQKEEGGSLFLNNTNEKIQELCQNISQDKSSYHAILEGTDQTVVMIIALEEKLENAFAWENLNSVADVISDTLEREKLKRDQADLIANLNKSLGELGTERSFSDSILESLNSGLLMIDHDGIITKANPAAKQLILTLYDGDIDGNHLEKIFGPESATLLKDNTTASSHEITVKNLGKKELILEFTTSPIFNHDDTLIGSVIAFSDVTEQRKMGAKVGKLTRLSAIAEIASAVAHEIKNPLAGIKSMSQILDGRLSDADENKEFINRILKQVDRLDGLLNEFFSYAKPPKPNKQNTILNDILRESWHIAEAKGSKKGLSLHENIGTDSAVLQADYEQLQQVFVNLFMNAIDAIEGTVVGQCRSNCRGA